MQSLLLHELVRTICSDKAREAPIQSRQMPTESRLPGRPRWRWSPAASIQRLSRRHSAVKGRA